MSEKQQCCATAYRPGGPMSQQWARCSRRGVVEFDGKHYCRQHSPEAEAKRNQDSAERYKKEIADRRTELAGPRFLAACEKIEARIIDVGRGLPGWIDKSPEEVLRQVAAVTIDSSTLLEVLAAIKQARGSA